MTTKETTIRAPIWQLMVVHPEQKTLIPFSNIDTKTQELLNNSDLKKLFPAENEKMKDSDVSTDYLKEKLGKTTEEKRSLEARISKLKEENEMLKEQFLKLQQLQTNNDGNTKEDDDTLSKYVCEAANSLGNNNDAPDSKGATTSIRQVDYRTSDIKHSSITDVVDAVVGLQRYDNKQ